MTIPSNVTTIQKLAFSECSNLSKVMIGNGIKKIEQSAFSNCPNLNDVYCLAYRYPTTNKSAFSNSYPDYITLHVPDKAVEQYRAVEPWSTFKAVVGVSSSTGATPCAKPTIDYQDGKITTACETADAQCVTIITVDDAKTYYTGDINLSVTYQISIYAIKPGYSNSEIASATLCWIDVEPQTEGFTNSVAQVPAHAVLIQSENGQVSVKGIDDGTAVAIYGTDGVKAGAGVGQGGQAVVSTNMPAGSIAIVKIGGRSVKVVMK